MQARVTKADPHERQALNENRAPKAWSSKRTLAKKTQAKGAQPRHQQGRARVEHVFAGLRQLGGRTVRAMTLARNELAIALKKCVAYNVKRLAWLLQHDPVR